ncbi:hypothetical protein NC652_033018 [Populus alba x Populus x berolinensis]|nr:hypothetical protein NC652_033018 [Populus alba x Populus x berolinensis]
MPIASSCWSFASHFGSKTKMKWIFPGKWTIPNARKSSGSRFLSNSYI